MLRSSGRREPAPLQRHRLLAAHDGTGSVHGGHAQVGAVLILADHVPDAAEGVPGVLVIQPFISRCIPKERKAKTERSICKAMFIAALFKIDKR